MAPKRKNNQDSEAVGQSKRARKAPTANVVSENSPQRSVVVGRNPRPTQPSFKVPVEWPEAPPNSKGVRSIVQTTIRRTAEELGLPPGVPAPILAIPYTPAGNPTRPDCKIVFPDLVLPTGVRPPWEEQSGPRFPSSFFSPVLSRLSFTPDAGFSMPQMRRKSSAASLSSQVPSSSRLFTPQPSAAQSGKITPAPKTKATSPHPFLRRVPRLFPSSQPLPETAQPPASQPASQPAPASQILRPAQNSPILDHEPTPSFMSSSHHSPPSKVSSNPIPLREENVVVSPVGAASPPPAVAHSLRPQPRPVQLSHQPTPRHSPPSNVSPNAVPLTGGNTMTVGAASLPLPVAHSSPPQPRPVQVSSQPTPRHSPPNNVSPNAIPFTRENIMTVGAASPPPPVLQTAYSPPPQSRPQQFSPQPGPAQVSFQPNPAFATSPLQVLHKVPPQPRLAQVSSQPNPAFATSPSRVPQGSPPQPRPLRREETMVWPSSFSSQSQPPVSHSPPQRNPALADPPPPTQGRVSSQAPTRPMHSVPQRPGPIPIPMQYVQPNSNRARYHGGSGQSNARGPSYPQPPRPQQQKQQQQQYRAPPPSASYHPGPPQQQQYRAPPPSTTYNPGQRQYQGGYNLNQQMHGSNQYPGAPSGAQTPYPQIPSNYHPYPAPAQEYNPAQPNFMSNNFGGGNQPGYPPSYMGQPPRNNGGYNGGGR